MTPGLHVSTVLAIRRSMSTRESKEDRKQPPKQPPRTTEPEAEPEARDRAGVDPFADENPAICRGMD
jgi:hypothetical protein